jgi:hypothetical protein
VFLPSVRPALPLILLAFLLAVVLNGCRLLPGGDVTLRWKTESELDIIGFNVYRAESPDGPYIKLNQALLPPAADPSVGGQHEFVDETARRGTTYYYDLESVDRNGGTTRSGPIAITAGE